MTHDFFSMADMRSSLVDLEVVLERLDRLECGIAAIHVEAAAYALKDNLAAMRRNSAFGDRLMDRSSRRKPILA